MPTGQLILNGVDDAQFEQILDVKKNHEGDVHILSLQMSGGGGPFSPPPPFPRPINPDTAHAELMGEPSPPPPFEQMETRYDITLTWSSPEGFSAISNIVQKIIAAP